MSGEKQPLDADGNCSSSERPRPQVIIVTEADGRERRFAADRWNLEKHGLTVHSDHDVIARYQPHAWLSVREEGALVPDGTKLALGIAKQALRVITKMGGPDSIHDAKRRADEALEEIFVETEL